MYHIIKSCPLYNQIYFEYPSLVSKQMVRSGPVQSSDILNSTHSIHLYCLLNASTSLYEQKGSVTKQAQPNVDCGARVTSSSTTPMQNCATKHAPDPTIPYTQF